jgi:ureidoglycolate hydrolase
MPAYAAASAGGQPDLSTMRSFLVLPSQSVTYGRDVWRESTRLSYGNDSVADAFSDPCQTMEP